ncbi:TspO and MBR [Rhodonellum psychrophilum GCM71 = DSM 17998]|uniref:TspO and MBR n=2 Tax=Rhodonellum TaxID=336827 RepID=U5C3X8_9BACT|nr:MULTISPECIES: TspO/MBR family protein [Rhodonellum]ERM82877.1 TspO and MBR [Rhodonellum psychrophilum GCM71 = DSM 17998]SDY46875.1 TspO and MBR related proteins [Rhodonellum ikkaensis]
MNNTLKLVISIVVPQLFGGLGALVTVASIGSWYQSIEKPFFTPPSWVFGPAWTLLYLMMGLAVYLIWKSQHPFKKQALVVFIAQLVLNAIWSPAFFGLESPILGLVIIIPLWVLILICIRLFFPINRIAAYLMIPYILWVSFAMLLNASIWYLNL